MLTGDRAYNRIALFDLQGRQVYASSPAAIHDELWGAVGDFIKTSRNAAPPSFHVGPPSSAHGESWQVPLLLPVTDTAGPRGALLLHLDLGYLLRLYQDIDIGDSGFIQVLESDGVELARARRGGLEIGDKAINPFLATGLQQGSRITPLFEDQKPYLVSYRRLDGYPFTVMVNQELADILAQFRSRKDKYLISLSFMTLIVMALTAGAVLMVRRYRLSFEAIARSEEEKHQLIEQLEEEKRRAYELASHDHLTGLANRRMFIELTTSHLARARRSRHHYALLFIDLDRFKTINDTLGHKVGDLLLQAVGQRLRETLRKSDIIARFGGDEFVVLLTGLEHETDVNAIAEKLVEAIGMPCTNLDGHDVQVAPSIGISLYPRDGQDLDTLIRHADTAMYQGKKLSRGTFTFFDQSLNTNSAHQFELEQRLPKAIAENEFVLCYQPKVELSNFRIVGFEALVRWQHPKHGLIFPNDFIPLAEETGHILTLGNWVVEAACRQLVEWRNEGHPLVPIAINLSARQLRDAALSSRIVAMLAEYGVEPALIQIEVTESCLVENIEIAGGILNELVAAGISVALDDFGNGFSSLGHIKSLPIDTIKIDRTFVKDILNSPDDSTIVESTIILAHNLGMRVVAEGIETREQLMYLKTAGCDEVQGYYFSRPVPHDRAREFLIEPTRVPA
ncbi:MAG: EAL domain-containing protein [Hydrogenophilaceae bacterium]|nr:EAL domain-containing protein [Hydrogenophilaceae bacterium]